MLGLQVARKLIDMNVQFAPRMATDTAWLISHHCLMAGILAGITRHIIWNIHPSSESCCCLMLLALRALLLLLCRHCAAGCRNLVLLGRRVGPNKMRQQQRVARAEPAMHLAASAPFGPPYCEPDTA